MCLLTITDAVRQMMLTNMSKSILLQPLVWVSRVFSVCVVGRYNLRTAALS